MTVSPSSVDLVQRCSLRWLLERHGGANVPTPEQGIGNLVHAAAMLAADATADRAALVDYVAGRFDAMLGLVLALVAIVVGILAVTNSLSWLNLDTDTVPQVRDWLVTHWNSVTGR